MSERVTVSEPAWEATTRMIARAYLRERRMCHAWLRAFWILLAVSVIGILLAGRELRHHDIACVTASQSGPYEGRLSPEDQASLILDCMKGKR